MIAPDFRRCFEKDFDFEAFADELWEYQRKENPVIRTFCGHLGTTKRTFIPIEFFKDTELKCGPDWEPALTFRSSGTTGEQTSRHFVKEPEIYRQSLLKGFRHFYGEGEFAIFALLPNYLERTDSSLVYMVKEWMSEFGTEESGFFLYDHAALRMQILQAMAQNRRILLIGVSFALLDFVEKFPVALPEDAIVMETGGMKGRRKELTREELHATLCEGFGVKQIHSEYGMTELLSQAYAPAGGLFNCPPWMKIVITDLWLPGRELPTGQAGRINIIDLMNVHSCAFIRTDDLGRLTPGAQFEVLGRVDVADMRGCNLLYER